jgi:competence protein ComEA
MPERSASTIAIWVVAAVLAVLAGMRLLGGGDPEPAPVRIDAPAMDSPPSAGTDRAGEGTLFVHVAGAVRRPGLIRVPQGSRVAVALERAGGPTRRADLTLVNLAARLQDGQQIVVPVAGAAAGGGAAGATGAAAGAARAGAAGGDLSGTAPRAPIHLSTATVEQLDEIDGIGPTLAGRIVEYRDAHGGFRSLDELSQVDGIGEKRLATLRDALQP